MNTKSIPLIVTVALFNACQSDSDISERFVLNTNSELNNSKDLVLIEKDLKEMNQFTTRLFIHDSVMENNISLNYNKFFNVKYEKVILKDEINKLFDPENKFCDLPEKVKKSLNKLKNKGKSWAPEYVVKHVKDLPDTALYIPRTSISALLHTIKIKSTDGATRNFPVLGSPTFKKLDVERFVLKEGYNAFFYSLDCSGFLNAAIEGSGAIPGADIQTSAKSAIERKKSMFIAGGVIISPLAAAYYGNGLGTDLDTIERKMILKELTLIPDILDSDTIYATASYEAIWMSNEGSSSFNGESNFGGRINQGIGIASITTSGESGGTVSRNSSFTAYKTYFTKRRIISDLKPFTIQQVKNKIQTLD
jgi:hypothetical protein